jgi:hypothetical protein
MRCVWCLRYLFQTCSAAEPLRDCLNFNEKRSISNGLARAQLAEALSVLHYSYSRRCAAPLASQCALYLFLRLLLRPSGVL